MPMNYKKEQVGMEGKKIRKLSDEYSRKKDDVVYCSYCQEFFINDVSYMQNVVCPDCNCTLARVDKQTIVEMIINKND